MAEVAASLLACNFLKIGSEVERMADAGACWIHFDVMDGHFVPNLTFGFSLLEDVARCALPVDVHLMIESPEQYVGRCADAGAENITVHVEACRDPERTVKLIRNSGCRPGIAISPSTPVERVLPLLDKVDLALVMTVHPGFGGQRLIPRTLDKVIQLDRIRKERGLDLRLEVDGGIDLNTARDAVNAGADVLVTGSALYHAEDAAEFIRRIRAMV